MNLDVPSWPAAPSWSIWVGSLGRGCVYAALILFILSSLCFLLTKKPELQRPAGLMFTIGCLCVFGAMGCLASLLLTHQFQYDYVRQTTEVGLAIQYRISALWAKQQGSFLLWAVSAAVFGVFAAPRSGVYRPWFSIVYAVFLGSLCGILAFETPFAITLSHGQALVPPNGMGMTPSLQNYWAVIHPPTIFLGFGALTVPYAWALAALFTKDLGGWTKLVRPWALACVGILGLGLCMGGLWAYETLGWGGFWAWDPVENTSLVPWLLMVAFAHGIIVQSAGRGWTKANLVLGALPFLSFVYGTYLTRSGIYSDLSNHSFAQMDRSALKVLLGLIGVSVLGFIVPFALAKKQAGTQKTDGKLSRSAGYSLGILLTSAIALATAFGMSVPLIMFLQGKAPKVVEEPLYHQVLSWPFPLFLILMACVPFLSWKGSTWKGLANRVGVAASTSFMFTGLALLIMRNPSIGVGITGTETVNFPGGREFPALPWLAFLLFLCFFTAVASFVRIIETRKARVMSHGAFVAHIGVAVLLAGLIISRGFERKETTFVQPGETGSALGYAIEFDKFTRSELSDRDNKALFHVQGMNGSFTAAPGLYTFTQGNQGENWMTWPHIERGLSHDIYFALHAPQSDVWKEAVSIKPGESHSDNNVTVTYKEFKMHGQPGKPGTKFGVVVDIVTPEGKFTAEPTVEISPQGLLPHLASINKDLMISMQGIDAGTRGALIQIHFAKPTFPIEVFYKPMTCLVWLGTGILALGGLMAAFYRRSPANPESDAKEPEPFA